MCDIAETVMLTRDSTDELCRLLALTVRAAAAGSRARVTGLEDYEPPSEVMAGWLAEQEGPPVTSQSAPRDKDPEVRAAQIMAVVRAFGGEAG